MIFILDDSPDTDENDESISINGEEIEFNDAAEEGSQDGPSFEELEEENFEVSETYKAMQARFEEENEAAK